MNRANFGNIVTNGMQILSVGATTASKIFLGRADSALNNLTKEERIKLKDMKTAQLREEMEDYYNPERKLNKQYKQDKQQEERETYYAGGSSPMQHLSLEEQAAFQEKKAEGIRSFINGESDDYESSFENPKLAIKNEEIPTPQGEETTIKINNDLKHNDRLSQRFSSPRTDLLFKKELMEVR